ncbi:MAG TPA: sigma-70 family RNA polymerase sigma factor [Actinomycetota bacterium]|nr:sigma-70 family RNA polymerase sigma factor [Actinomycetota bacterium]
MNLSRSSGNLDGVRAVKGVDHSMEGRPLEEAELVEQARRGDVGAYEELVRMYQRLAVRTAYVITGDGSEAQDATQEAFVKAYHSLSRFRAGAPFRPWLLRIVANEAINRRNAARRRGRLALRVAESRWPDDAAPSPEAAALGHELRRDVVAAMNRLRAEDRLVVAYRFFFDLSEAEMAEALGCRRGTVKSRLSRALDRLRRALPEGMKEDRGSVGSEAR